MSLINRQFSPSSVSYASVMTIARDGSIYAQGTTNNNIYVYSYTGTLKNTITNVLDSYRSMCTDFSNNRIYCAGAIYVSVLDISTNTITTNYIFGEALNGIAISETGALYLNISSWDGYAYVITSSGYRVRRISISNGSKNNIFDGSATVTADAYGAFAACTFDRTGWLYCITKGNGNVYKINISSGGILTTILNPLSIGGFVTGLGCHYNSFDLYISRTNGASGNVYKLNTSSSIISSVASYVLTPYAFTQYPVKSLVFDASSRNQFIVLDQDDSNGTVNNIYISPLYNRTFNINNTSLLYYYPFDIDYLNYRDVSGVSSLTVNASIRLIYENYIMPNNTLTIPGSSTQSVAMPSTTFGGDGITIAVWLRCTSIPTNGARLFDFGNGVNTHNFYGGVSTNGAMQIGFYSPSIGTQGNYSLNYTIPNTLWHHYAIIISSTGAVSFYVDGSGISGINHTVYPYRSALANCFIAKSSNTSDGYITCHLNSFLLFNRVITYTELLYLINSPKQIRCSSLATNILTPNNTYSTDPEKFAYGQYIGFKLSCSSPKFITNTRYSLKSGLTVLSTVNYNGTVVGSNYTLATYSSVIDNSGILWVHSTMNYGNTEGLFRVDRNRLDGFGNNTPILNQYLFPSFIPNKDNPRTLYYNNRIYVVSSSGYSNSRFGYFVVFDILTLTYVRWQANNYYNDMAIGSDGFGYATSSHWAGSTQYTNQWSVDRINLQTYETTRLIPGTSTIFEGIVDNYGGLTSIVFDSSDNFYVLTRGGYLTKWTTAGTRILAPVQLMRPISGALRSGVMEYNKNTNTLYICSYDSTLNGIFTVNLSTYATKLIISSNGDFRGLFIDYNERKLYYNGLSRLDLDEVPTLNFNVSPTTIDNFSLQVTDDKGLDTEFNIVIQGDYPCFLEGSKILRLNVEYDEEEYIPIEKLKKGDLIKTATCGYKAIAFIGRKKLKDPTNDPVKKNRLYTFKANGFSPLSLTGEHCTLHKNLTDDKRREVRKYMGDDFITEEFYRVPACLDDRAEPYTGKGPATIWHFALEHNNLYNNYAVYANGILVETCSIDYLLKHSNMELI